MPLYRWSYISKQSVRFNRDFIFVFGDNYTVPAHRQYTNIVGIPTKFSDGKHAQAYLKDVDYGTISADWARTFGRLEAFLKSGKCIVFPSGGIGTGRADLKKRAPRLFSYLQMRIKRLDDIEKASKQQPAHA